MANNNHHPMVIPTRTGSVNARATEKAVASEKFARWEALRQRINTIGGHAALEEAMRVKAERRAS